MDLIAQSTGVVKAEYQLRHMKWMSVSMDVKPDTALHALDFCNNTFLTILLILQIMAILTNYFYRTS